MQKKKIMLPFDFAYKTVCGVAHNKKERKKKQNNKTRTKLLSLAA